MPRSWPRVCLLLALVFTGGFAGPGTAGAQSREAQTWVTYANGRFGSTLDYPADWFTPGPAPANGDGRQFRDRETGASFVIFGAYNTADQSLRQLEASERENYSDARITYRRAKKNWFVLSGFRGRDVFYHKVILSNRGRIIHSLIITYPKALKADFDRVTTVMSRSMRVSRALETD